MATSSQSIPAGSVVYTLGFALLADTVPEEDLGHWMGFALFSLNVGIIIGPSIGGVLYDTFGYSSLFTAVFALVTVDIILRVLMIEKKVASNISELSEGETERLCESLDSGSPQGYGTAQSASTARDEVAKNSLSSNIEVRPISPADKTDPVLNPKITSSTHPFPIKTLLTSPRILTDLYGAFISIFVLVSFDAAIPIFVDDHFGWTSTKSGLVFLFISMPVLIGPLAGKLYDRCPYPWLTASFFLLSAGFVALLGLVTYEGFGRVVQEVLLLALLTLYGFANSFGSLPLSADLTRAVTYIEEETPGIFGASGASAQVYALYTSASAAGVVFGLVWTSFVFEYGNWEYLVLSLGALTSTVALPVLLTRKVERTTNSGVLPASV